MARSTCVRHGLFIWVLGRLQRYVLIEGDYTLSFIRSFVHSFIRSFVHSFILSLEIHRDLTGLLRVSGPVSGCADRR
jgi:hypothetical protein